MLSPVHDVRQEKAELQKIPLFNPRFRAAFPALAPRAILSIAGILLAAGIWWLAPWRHGYTSDERVKIWFGIAVMPFAAVLVSSFVVEYLLKSMQVAWWAIRRALVLNPTARLLGSIALGLLVTGAGLAVSGGDRDAWGFVGLFLGIFLSYWFVTTAWDLNER